MTGHGPPKILTGVALLAMLLASTQAEAFRCGRKLVTKNMHEIQVKKVCGEPTTERHLGYAVRGATFPLRHTVGGVTVRTGHGRRYYVEEVAITEYVYNFGPRRFMRRLLFEGGVLVRIESVGYGYRE